jgi:hypothetical protein
MPPEEQVPDYKSYIESAININYEYADNDQKSYRVVINLEDIITDEYSYNVAIKGIPTGQETPETSFPINLSGNNPVSFNVDNQNPITLNLEIDVKDKNGKSVDKYQYEPKITTRDDLKQEEDSENNYVTTNTHPVPVTVNVAVAGSGGGVGQNAVTVVLPISCPVAFYGCEPAPQQRPIDNQTKLPLNTAPDAPYSDGFSAGFFAAKCMGLVKKDGAVYKPIWAYYSSAEKIPVFAWESAKETPPIPEGTQGTWSVFFTYPYELGALYRFTGYRQVPITGEQIFADPETKSVPLYRRALRVKQQGGMAVVEPAIAGVPHYNGWVQLEYVDRGQELVELPPVNTPEGWAFLTFNADGGMQISKTFEKPAPSPEGTEEEQPPETKTEVIVIPRQGGTENTGSYVFQKCDVATGRCIYAYTPRVPDYQQRSEFPFWFGLTHASPWGLTSNISEAQLDYDPCVCNKLDRNERLIPGQRVEYTEQTTRLTYRLPEEDGIVKTDVKLFSYCSAVPPNEYSVSFEGTPTMLVGRFSKGSKVSYGTTSSATDYYIGSYELFDEMPGDGFPYPYSGFICLNDQGGAPKIEQPFGVFHDCDNPALTGLFIRDDDTGVKYPMTARLAHVPFGYAIETKTPACFYKVSADENCAPRMVGLQYLVARADTMLEIRGACYKPCTSLTQL